MFDRSGDRRVCKGGVLAPLLAVLALTFQLVVAEPCAGAEPVSASVHVADAHCSEAVADEQGGGESTPAPDADDCCECLAPAAAPVPQPDPIVLAERRAISAADLRPPATPPVLRAIASGPPSQAPPRI